MIEFVWFFLVTVFWPVILAITVIASVISLILPYIAAAFLILAGLVIGGLGIGTFFSSSIWGRLKIIAWVVAIAVAFALPYLVHNRGWSALAALGYVLALFTYNQVREI
jgi:hypothetical protein